MTPEKFGDILCDDLDLPAYKFTPLIAESIRAQVLDFESIHEVEIPDDGMRVVINVRMSVTLDKERRFFGVNLVLL